MENRNESKIVVPEAAELPDKELDEVSGGYLRPIASGKQLLKTGDGEKKDS